MVKCCVAGCRSSSAASASNPGIRLHRFPTKDQALSRKWIKFAIRSGTKLYRLDLDELGTHNHNARICSRHFEDSKRDENPEPTRTAYGEFVSLDPNSPEARYIALLDMEDAEAENPSYQFTKEADMKLEDLIDAKLAELDFGSLLDKATDQLDNRLKQQERKTREVNQLFATCEEQLKALCEHYEEEMVLDSAAPKSDSDDDVQFVEAGFEPRFVRQQQQPRFVVQGERRIVINPISQASGAASVNPIKPAAYSAIAAQGHIPIRPPIYQQRNPTQPKPSTPQSLVSIEADGSSSTQMLRPHTTMYAPPPQPADLVVGMKLFGKKFNDIWYRGTLTEIHNKEKPRSEWRYRIKFDYKGMKVLPGKQIAFADAPNDALPVGSRVVALYKDEDAVSSNSHYAGIIAESPSIRNNQRYLIFFDDGYAQYCYSKEIHKVYEQSRNVWEDIHPDSQEFIKSYLKQYPERPMVRLQKGQVIKTEWNGQWWTARVEVADASLVKMYFDADKRVEWIYRGSTRLEPLYTELANAEKSQAGGKAHRKHHFGVKSSKKPFVEYLRGTESDYMKLARPSLPKPKLILPPPPPPSQLVRNINTENLCKKRSVAKKSTSKNQVPEPPERKNYSTSSISRMGQGNRMSNDYYTTWGDDEALGQRIDVNLANPPVAPKKFTPHMCSKYCLEDDDPARHLGHNPLIIPMLCGWERQIAKQKSLHKRCVFYRAPCGRRFRSLDDIEDYLLLTSSNFTIDFFCFDVNLHTHSEFVPIKTFCDIKDLSYGKETVVISCVNGIDRQYPDYVEYSNRRIPAKGVKLNLHTDFLVGCECPPGKCGDPRTCSCARLTFEARDALPKVIQPESVGYEHRRLNENIISGIYECNSNCKCDHRCPNRVAQNGLQLRLQVFKTEKRGWGLRCLDDIPAGGFICVYAGQLLTEQGANEDGQQYGDEYLAELDYIEVVERTKEGYESDVVGVSDEEESKEQEEDMEDDDDDEHEDFAAASDSDSTFSGEKYVNTAKLTEGPNRKSSRRCTKKEKEGQQAKNGSTKIIIKRHNDQDKSWSVKVKSPQSKTKEWVDSIPDPRAESTDTIVISDEDEKKEKKPEENDGRAEEEKREEEKMDTTEGEKRDSDLDSLGEQKLGPPVGTPGKVKLNLKSKVYGAINEDVLVVDENKEGKAENKPESKPDGKPKRLAEEDENSQDSVTKKTADMEDNNSDSKDGLGSNDKDGRKSRFHNLPDPRSQQMITPAKGKLGNDETNISDDKTAKEKDKKEANDSAMEVDDDDSKFDSRRFFNEEFCYVMDAKSMGNIGRYLNHSCAPNVFVQNVFVDTHDLRFPWVAFFAAQYIRAGTELTWDYNYEVGSVHGKILYCYCGAADCRGRLL